MKWRKLFHLLGLFVIIYFFIDRITAIYSLIFLLTLDFIIEVLRFRSKWFKEHFLSKTSLLVRKKEEKQFLGTTWFFLGATLTVLIFEKQIAILSLLVLVMADPMAEAFGKSFGKKKLFKDKSYIGTLAFLFTSLIVCSVYSIFYPLSLLQILFASFGATFAEIFTFKLDDNLTIPIITGLILSIF